MVGLPRADAFAPGARLPALPDPRDDARRWLARFERLLNFVCPKSLILYARKPEAAARRERAA